MRRAAVAANAQRFVPVIRAGRHKALPLLISMSALALGACTTSPIQTAATETQAAKSPTEARKRAIALAKADPREKDCLVRAMYFESNRSSESGLLGVGTVVLNRVESPQYPSTICGVVGAPQQFASGVLTRKMAERDLPKVHAVAEAILDGKRSEAVANAKHFHMAGMRFSYPNMHYVTVAGGNAFYVKGERPERRRIEEPATQVAMASEPVATESVASEPVAAASTASVASTAFTGAPLAFAPSTPSPVAATLASAAPNLLGKAPLPPSRPFNLDLRKKTAKADTEQPASGARLAALMPEKTGLRGSLRSD